MPDNQLIVHHFKVQETLDVIMWRDGQWRNGEWDPGEWAVAGRDSLGFADMLSRPALLQNPLLMSDPPTLAWRMASSYSDVADAVRKHAREKGVTIATSRVAYTFTGGFPGWIAESEDL